jgi:formylglycine-generating enzyme required for sulfatase activity
MEPTGGPPVATGQRYYQLTHDYLVPSLRDWLTRKQKETRRGRAELRLAERAALWNGKPENRHLPTWWEWLNVRLFTRQCNWTPPQRRMMRRAGRHYRFRGALLTLTLALLAFGGWWMYGYLRARALVDLLLAAQTADVPLVVDRLEPYRRWADPLLRERAAWRDVEPYLRIPGWGPLQRARANPIHQGLDEDQRLRVALALLPVDAGQTDYVCERLLTAQRPDQVKAVRELLQAHAPDAAARFWPVLQDNKEGKARHLRAACALALVAPDDERWAAVSDEVARCLGEENVVLLGEWAALLKPERGHLVPPLAQRLVEADASGFPAYLAVLSVYPEETVAELHRHLQYIVPPGATEETQHALAQQQAQAAVALLRLGQPERVWPLLHQGADPTGRTYLIHRCAALRVDPAILVHRLLGNEEKDPSVRQGLLLALGEYPMDQRAEVVRGSLVERVVAVYRDDPDPGVHSAAEWLLRRWQLLDRLGPIDQELRRAGPRRLAGAVAKPRWYVNGQGQTFAVLPAPGQFEVGSPPDERGRFTIEDLRRVQIDYPFAVALKLVTVAEFEKFRPRPNHMKQCSPGEDTPINGVTWYEAAAYCNWLSAQEKVPQDQWCYEPNSKGEYAEGMKVKANYQGLSGYRLPRDAEWEYACRAGTVTAWSHGSDDALLRHYAWYTTNAGSTMHSVGSLKPNGLGLFDVHGNAWQWCQDAYQVREIKDLEDINSNISRARRSGAFSSDAGYARSAFCNGFAPATRHDHVGFRVARTYR